MPYLAAYVPPHWTVLHVDEAVEPVDLEMAGRRGLSTAAHEPRGTLGRISIREQAILPLGRCMEAPVTVPRSVVLDLAAEPDLATALRYRQQGLTGCR